MRKSISKYPLHIEGKSIVEQKTGNLLKIQDNNLKIIIISDLYTDNKNEGIYTIWFEIF